MRPALLLVAATASLACASSRAPDDPRRLIGKPLPERQDAWQGWGYGDAHLVRDATPQFADITWTKGSDAALFLTLVEGANTPARRETIVDALVVRMIPGTFISMQCELDATPDPEIAAQVVATEQRWYTDVRQAWRLDLTKRRIAEMAVKGVRCVNESFDGDPD